MNSKVEGSPFNNIGAHVMASRRLPACQPRRDDNDQLLLLVFQRI